MNINQDISQITSVDEFVSQIGLKYGAKDMWDSFSDEDKYYIESVFTERRKEFKTADDINNFIWFSVRDLIDEFKLME